MHSIRISDSIRVLLEVCNNSVIRSDTIVIKYLGVPNSAGYPSPQFCYIPAYAHLQPILEFAYKTDNLKIHNIKLIYDSTITEHIHTSAISILKSQIFNI